MQDDQILEYAPFSELDELDKLLTFYTRQTPLNLSLKEPLVAFVAWSSHFQKQFGAT